MFPAEILCIILDHAFRASDSDPCNIAQVCKTWKMIHDEHEHLRLLGFMKTNGNTPGIVKNTGIAYVLIAIATILGMEGKLSGSQFCDDYSFAYWPGGMINTCTRGVNNTQTYPTFIASLPLKIDSISEKSFADCGTCLFPTQAFFTQTKTGDPFYLLLDDKLDSCDVRDTQSSKSPFWMVHTEFIRRLVKEKPVFLVGLCKRFEQHGIKKMW